MKHTLNVKSRTQVGKGAVKKVMKEGLIPAVIYGNKQAPVSIKLDPRDLEKEFTADFKTKQFEIVIDGKGKELTMCQSVQFHVVKDNPIHADFLRIDANKELTVAVPLNFINEETCKGIKVGGTLNIVRRELELACKPKDIPSEIVIDVADLEIGDSIHMQEIKLPANTKMANEDEDFTVATIVAATQESEEETTEEEANVEVEATKQKDAEEEA